MAGPRSALFAAPFTLLATLCLAPGDAVGQQPPAPVLAGTVYGVGGAPLEGADVVVIGRQERVRTDAAGRFRIEGLPSNRYALLIRAVGYEPSRIVAVLGEAGMTDLEIFLIQIPYTLQNIVVVGERRGVHGRVLGPDLQPVAGAEVRVLGGGAVMRTDSTGQFSFPDKHGSTYALRVTADGYISQPVHLRIPTGQSREVTIHMAEVYPGYEPVFREEEHYRDLGERLAWRSPLTRIPHDELERFEGMRVCDMPKVRFSLSRIMESGLPFYTVVDGHLVLESILPCYWLADEVALVELGVSCGKDGIAGMFLSTSGQRPRITAPNRRASAPSRLEGSCVAIWLKGNMAQVEVP